MQKDAGYCAYKYLSDDGMVSSLTLGQLDQAGSGDCAWLQDRCSIGDRVLLVYPPGLEFVTAFFGCLYAGALPVPATYPKPRRPMPRLLAIGIDCVAESALTTSQALETLQLPTSGEDGQQIGWLATDTVSDDQAGQWRRPFLTAEDLAFLQYTSGSTSEPKGVMVTHGPVHNLAVIHRAFGLDRIHADGIEPVSVWWLPAYHDMGLIGGIGAVHNEGHLILMSPIRPETTAELVAGDVGLPCHGQRGAEFRLFAASARRLLKNGQRLIRANAVGLPPSRSVRQLKALQRHLVRRFSRRSVLSLLRARGGDVAGVGR